MASPLACFCSQFKRPASYAGLLAAALLLMPAGLPLTPDFRRVGTAAAQTAVPGRFSETYGDWIAHCALRDTEDGQQLRQCAMEQRLSWHDENSGQTRQLLTVALTPRQASGAELTILTPFGLLLDRGIVLQVDEGKSYSLPFQTCLPAGCLARGLLDEAILGQLRTGQVLATRMVQSDGEQVVRVEVSLKGFTDSYARLQQAVSQ